MCFRDKIPQSGTWKSASQLEILLRLNFIQVANVGPNSRGKIALPRRCSPTSSDDWCIFERPSLTPSEKPSPLLHAPLSSTTSSRPFLEWGAQLSPPVAARRGQQHSGQWHSTKLSSCRGTRPRKGRPKRKMARAHRHCRPVKRRGLQSTRAGA